MLKVAPLLLAGLVGCTASRSQFGAASPRNLEQAHPDDLNGHAHRLAFYAADSSRRIQYHHLGHGRYAPNQPLAIGAVGADLFVRIPQKLGVGHGPFRQVYAENSTPKVSVMDGLRLSSASWVDEGVFVKCERAGVFELSADAIDQNGQVLHDSRTIECLVPTRFEASIKGRFIANGTILYVGCAWFGKRADGQEVKLMGFLPVAVSPEETAISLKEPVDDIGATFWPLRATTAPSITSAGFTVTLPIEIIDSHWTLDLMFYESGNHLWATAYGLDDKGEKIRLDSCAIKAHTGGVVTDRGILCEFGILRNNGAPMQRPHEWTADEICVSSVGQTICKPVPR
jgi:hypothetical protein